MSALEQLGLNDDSSEDDVKAAWRRLAMLHHPDRGGDPNVFNDLRKAYEAALLIVNEPTDCAACQGSGKIKIKHGWAETTLHCEECGGTGLLQKQKGNQ